MYLLCTHFLQKSYKFQKRHLVAVKRVDEPSFQQVQDLYCPVIGSTDQIVSRWVEGKIVDAGTMNCKIRSECKSLKNSNTSLKKFLWVNVCDAKPIPLPL